jgi:hypothetical protein
MPYSPTPAATVNQDVSVMYAKKDAYNRNSLQSQLDAAQQTLDNAANEVQAAAQKVQADAQTYIP